MPPRVPPEVRFDIAAIARLRIPDTHHDDGPPAEVVWEERNDYARELAEEYEVLVDEVYLAVPEVEAGSLPDRPDMVARELGRVSAELAALEEYRNRLIVFARALASTPATARAVADRTGLSHSTVVRMVTAEAIATMSADLAPLAANLLEEVHPGEAPGFYLRLRSVAQTGVS